jgi:ribosomal protein L11 methyltransferase
MTKIPTVRVDHTWFEITIPSHAERIDLMTGTLAARGIAASEVREPRPGSAEIVVYVEAPDLAGAQAKADEIADSLPDVDRADVSVRPTVAQTVWTENWRRYFPAMRVGERLAVVPPWESDRDPERITLVINPGGAFGTGKHETTSLCLAALEARIKPGDRVADIGCGSGILAIAAIKLGASEALATDMDPAAIEATLENAETNGVSRFITARLIHPTDAGALAGQRFDVVVANIYADTLVAMAADLAGSLAAGGRLILSGIESTRTPGVENAFCGRGLRLIDGHAAGEWAALVFERATA